MSDTKYDASNDISTPAEYIRTNFDISDRIAVLVRNPKRAVKRHNASALQRR